MKRKGLIAVVLATIATLWGGLAVQSYVWDISYTVDPLVENSVTLDIGTRSGATYVSYSETETDALKNLPNKADLKFQIGAGDLAGMFRDWYHFNVTFEVIGTDGSTVVGSDYIEFTDTNENGVKDSGEVSSNPAVITLDPAENYDGDGKNFGDTTHDIKWTVYGKTGALKKSTGSVSVPVAIYAVEK